ncbi:MAG TPA: outer membrane lipoprotein-sorting protein [Flavobacteriales bacterium]|nr:outer membrane lipoprotein-sorting protein [Flavobacteriales bacterium]
MSFFRSVCLVLLCTVQLAAFSQDVTEIITKADEKMRGNSSKGEAIMQIVRPDWTREVRMKMWSLGTNKSMVLVTGPPRDKGLATLMRDQEIWNWQPSIERIIKLPPSMMMQSWMGSDFTNDDLVKQSSIVTDYTHKLLKDTVIENRPCYKIELIPKENAPVVWGKIEMCISKAEYLQLQVKFYDEDGYLVNTMKASGIKTMGGRVIPSFLEITPADNPKQKTTFEYLNLEFDIKLEDSFFSIQNMKRVR